MFTKQDKETIESRGLSVSAIEEQLAHFQEGFPPLDIVEPAVPGNGITQLDQAEQNRYAARYEGWKGTRVNLCRHRERPAGCSATCFKRKKNCKQAASKP